MAEEFKNIKFKYDPLTDEIGEIIEENDTTDDGKYITILISSEEEQLAANNELFNYYTPIIIDEENGDPQTAIIIPKVLEKNLEKKAAADNTTVQEIVLAEIEKAYTNGYKQGKRDRRREAKVKAEELNAIMEIKGGNYTIFSNDALWEAFAPRHIVKMGTLDRNFINQETGEITNDALTADLIKTGEFEKTKALEIPYNAVVLISTIMQNSVKDVRTEFIKNGQITFYVKGIIESFTEDPRGLISEKVKNSLLDQQLTLDRKTAGVLYLEDQFKPLQELIGIMPNGSRYSVFNYVGYDAETDTMTIISPYIFQLWKTTQESYFIRQRNQAEAKRLNKKPHVNDQKPLEVNYLLKGSTYQEDPITFEIAVYITNKILQAGYKGKTKTTDINYKTLINECPRLRERLADIESKRGTLTDKGKPVNITALYNAEFKKIKKAFDLIQDPEKCDFLNEYEIIDIAPANKKENSCFEFIPPTKSLIDGKLKLKWKKKQNNL